VQRRDRSPASTNAGPDPAWTDQPAAEPGRAQAWIVPVGLLLLALILAGGAVWLTIESPPPPSRASVSAPRPPVAANTGPAVFAIAHEAGRSRATASNALAWGADAVEVDLVACRGQLYVSHSPLPNNPPPTAPTLRQVWATDSEARVVELDLKQSTPAFRQLLLAFLASHRGAGHPQIFVSSRDIATLRAVQAGAPNVFRFLSIDSVAELRALRASPSMQALLDGVSIDQNFLDPPTIAWLHAHHLLIFVWTVDDPTRAQALLSEGVNGITTDQSTIGRLVLHHDRTAPVLLHRAPATLHTAAAPLDRVM